MEVSRLADIQFANDVELVLLDLDNTLYEYKRCHEIALRAVAEELSREFNITTERGEELYMECRKAVHNHHHHTATSHSRLFYIQRIVEKICQTTDSALTLKLYHLYWDTYIESMVLYDDALDFLERCKAQNKPIVLVTDMTAEVQFKKILKLNIGRYFKYIVTSEEAGIEKPSPLIFEYAIDKIKPELNSIKTLAVVGDNIKKDVFNSTEYNSVIYHILRDE